MFLLHRLAREGIRRGLYPSVIGLSLVATHAGLQAGHDPTCVVICVLLMACLPLLLAQRWIPYETHWRATPRHYGLDLLHTVSTGLTTECGRAVALGALVWSCGTLSNAMDMNFWPAEQVIWAQLAGALLLGDFGAYWVHRSCHRSPWLWRIHAMHHTSERLYVFSSGRNHPINALMAYGSQLLPLILLGAPMDVIALLSVFTGVHGMLQHANIDLHHGWLNHVFATADLHRWHHSTRHDDSNTNFGSNLILWDWVFSTRYLPAHRTVHAVGLPELHLPENFLHHLISPFRLHRWIRRPHEPSPTRLGMEVAEAEPTMSRMTGVRQMRTPLRQHS